MPNYCGNRLTIHGDIVKRDEFVSGVRGNPVPWELEETVIEVDPFSFHAIIPVPPECHRFHMTGYQWCLQNWGTKWNAVNTELLHDGHETCYTFLTAWGPPSVNFLTILANKFPDVSMDLRYAERGCRFYGYWKSNGEAKEWTLSNNDYIERVGLEIYAALWNRSG